MRNHRALFLFNERELPGQTYAGPNLCWPETHRTSPCAELTDVKHHVTA